MRADQLLVERGLAASRSQAQRLIAAGVLTVLVGILIAMRWPTNSLWVLGMFLAIDMIFQGWTSIALGLALKSGNRA